MRVRALLRSVLAIAVISVITSSACAYDIAGYRSASARAYNSKDTELKGVRLGLLHKYSAW